MATKRSFIFSLAFLLSLAFSGMAISAEAPAEDTLSAEQPAVEQPQQKPAAAEKKKTAVKKKAKKRKKKHSKVSVKQQNTKQQAPTK